jgi:hypothetical protein
MVFFRIATTFGLNQALLNVFFLVADLFRDRFVFVVIVGVGFGVVRGRAWLECEVGSARCYNDGGEDPVSSGD